MFEIEESGAASSFELEETYTPSAVIKVLGVGGAGGNAVNRMIEAGVRGVEFIAMNTDMQVLAKNLAPVKLQLGAKLTGGKGVGADPEKGRQAALESEAEILELIKGADMIFVAAGMGKGTGTGAAPVVAEISRRLGILTIPVVTRPFKFEGAACQRRAEQGLQALSKVTDSTLVIHNDKIMAVAGRVPLTDALRQADDTLRHAIQSISDVVTSEGLMNCDFNDVRAIMNERGGIYMGVGAADGDDAAPRAIEMALANPYLDDSGARGLAGARGMLIMISVKDEQKFTAMNLESILQVAGARASREANMIHGLAFNPLQTEELRVTVVAAGFEGGEKQKAGDRAWSVSMDGLNLNGTKVFKEAPARGDMGAPSFSEDLDIPAFMRRRHADAFETAGKPE